MPSDVTTFIGISGIGVKTTTVDFTVEFQAVYVNIPEFAVKMTAGANCAIDSIDHFVLSTFDCKVH